MNDFDRGFRAGYLAGLDDARQTTLAVLRGLRSDGNSTQLRAIIASIEELKGKQ